MKGSVLRFDFAGLLFVVDRVGSRFSARVSIEVLKHGGIRVQQVVLVVGERIEVAAQRSARKRVGRRVARRKAVQVTIVVAGVAEQMIEVVRIAVGRIADRTVDRTGQAAAEREY